MGLIIRTKADGTLFPNWWGRVTLNKHDNQKDLGVAIRGEIPRGENGKVSLALEGDKTFEQSRKAAQRALAEWRKEIRSNGKADGKPGVPLADLFKKWQGLKRQCEPTAERQRIARKTFQRFAAFARKYAKGEGKRCETLHDITPDIAGAWFDSLKGEYAWGTVKDAMHLLSGAFNRWATNGEPNPFGDILLRGNKVAGEEKKRTERKALTPDQFTKLLDCTRENERLYPLVVCAAYTGMRIGDICRLKVADIDFEKGEIDCVTAKAGVRVRIPFLSQELRRVLEEGCAVPADGETASPYVFPRAAWQYGNNRTAIIRAVKPYFARAVFGDEPPAEDATLVSEGESGEEDTPAPDIEKALAATRWSEAKRERVLTVYRRFKAGEASSKIAEEMGLARGQISNYLKDAERLTGEALRPRADRHAAPDCADLIERTRVERTVGKYAASVWGWHNLRHNFITCALNNGVPLHKVAAIVGHKTTAITAGYADTQTDTKDGRGGFAPLPVPAAEVSIDNLVAGLTEDQRKLLARKLLGL